MLESLHVPFAVAIPINLTQRLVLVLSTLTIAAATHAIPLRIGATPGALVDSVKVTAAEARKQGLDVRVVELTDWTTPSVALASGDLDLNYSRHQAFLDNVIKERGYASKSVGIGVLGNIGLYSSKIRRLSDLKDGAYVAVANDPVNQGRGLLLLQETGLIKLRDGVGTRGTLNDVVANPKKLKFVKIEGPQLVRALDDMDFAQGYPAHFVNAGKLDVTSASLLYSGVDDKYFVIRFVARNDDANDPRIARFIKLYQNSPVVRRQARASYASDGKLFTLPWVKRWHGKAPRP